MSSKKLTATVVGFVTFAAMFIGTLWLLKWGKDNDIPGLTEAADVMSSF